MKVICIENNDRDAFPANIKELIVGDTYNVLATVQGYGQSGKYEPCYILKEFPLDACYPCRWFAACSEIDETEFERNYKKELV